MQDERESYWKKVEERIGGELGLATVRALKELYSHLDRRMLRWAAGLYDHSVGGAYYANSARDTDGYLPDIESTWDIIVLPYSTGAMKKYGASLEEAIGRGYPDWFKAKVRDYMIDLQEPDGYFYHPQWPKHTHTVSRLGRDRGSATTLIRAFGGTPRYQLSSAAATDSTKENVPALKNMLNLTKIIKNAKNFKKVLQL